MITTVTSPRTPASATEGPAPSAPLVEMAYIELLKLKSAEASSLQANIIKTVGLYLAVTGALLKFALDVNSTPELRGALSYMGALTSLLLWVACLFGAAYRRRLVEELGQLYDALALQARPDYLLGIRYSIWAASLLGFSAFVGWILLIADS